MSDPTSNAVLTSADIPDELGSAAILPGDDRYEQRQSVYSTPGAPAVIFAVSSVDEVRAALAFASSHRDLPLAVRSGGHSIAGASTNVGGIVIDLSDSRELTVVDEEAGIVKAGPGLPSGLLLTGLQERGWVVPVPTFGDTAVGGVATAGGIGLLARSLGVTLDSVTGFDVVLADGRAVRADKDSEPELFWALRGTGATAGVVTSVEFKATPLPEVLSATTTVAPGDRIADVLYAWAQAAQQAPREVTSAFLANRSKDDGSLRVTINTVWAGSDSPEAQAALAPFLAVDAEAVGSVKTVLYSATVFTPGFPHVGKRSAIFRNGFSPALDRAASDALAELLDHPEVTTVNLRGFGGAVADVPVEETAFVNRSGEYLVSVWGAVDRQDAFESIWSTVRPRFHGVYAGYTDQTDEETLAAAFSDAVRERLARVRAEYDPTGLFAHTPAVR